MITLLFWFNSVLKSFLRDFAHGQNVGIVS